MLIKRACVVELGPTTGTVDVRFFEHVDSEYVLGEVGKSPKHAATVELIVVHVPFLKGAADEFLGNSGKPKPTVSSVFVWLISITTCLVAALSSAGVGVSLAVTSPRCLSLLVSFVASLFGFGG